MTVDDFRAMSLDERRAFIHEAAERGHKRDYEAALAWVGAEGPAWEDLTDEQREAVRVENRRYAQELHEFGQAIAKGDAFRPDSQPEP